VNFGQVARFWTKNSYQMLHVGSRNNGVDFLLENMQSDQFSQTLLGFNCVVRMVLDKSTKNLTISFEAPQFAQWQEVTEKKLEGALKEKFGEQLTTVSDSGFDLVVPCPDGVSDKEKDLASTLRDTVFVEAIKTAVSMCAPQKRYQWNKHGRKITLSSRCAVWVGQGENNTIATLVYQKPTNAMEQEMLNVFLQEFQLTRRNASLQAAPNVNYRSKDEGSDFPVLDFAFGARHTKDMDKVARMIYAVHDDIEYHIKASKTYIHNQMATQVKSWLKALNAADPTKADGNKSKKMRRSLRNA